MTIEANLRLSLPLPGYYLPDFIKYFILICTFLIKIAWSNSCFSSPEFYMLYHLSNFRKES